MTLRRMLRPPYCYRLAGLITALIAVVAGIAAVVQPDPVPAGRPAKAAPAHVVAPQPTPISPDLITHTTAPGRLIALTFDDGPHPSYTRQVLQLLAANHAVATFCMIGSQALLHPEVVRSVVAAGMRLCDHTAHHDESLDSKPDSVVEREIDDGRADLRTAAGPAVEVGYFRAPGGYWSARMRQRAARSGMRPLAWSIDPADWRRPGVAQIVSTIQRQVRPGAVILLHDGGGNREQTVQALGELLPWLIAQGYRFGFPG